MLRRTLRTLSSLTPSRSLSPYSIFTAKCSTSSPPRLGDPDPRSVRVSVWWDLDSCNVPSGVNVLRGAQAITTAIQSSGIKGPIEIQAFGDMERLAKTTTQEIDEAIPSAEIQFRYIPPPPASYSYSKWDSADCYLFLDLMRWVSQNPPPVHLFLVTADGGPSACLHQLRMDNYNVLLAAKESAPAFVCSAATILWDWDTLVRGENLTGRYFNQPPGFWYGRYEGSLEDPFTEIERQLGELQTHEVK